MKKHAKEWLSGIIPPMVTPLLTHDKLDLPGLERLIEHLISGGVNGLFILGTTGEGPSLSIALKRELIEATVQLVNKRVAVLVGITDSSLQESLQLAQFAADAGATAVVASTPFYYQVSQEELLKHIEQISASVQLPLVLYNIPQLTKTWFEVDTVRQALEFENVVGMKDSSGDMDYFKKIQEVIAEHEDCSLMVGPEEKLAEAIRIGANGGVCGGANLFPKLFVDLCNASSIDDEKTTSELHEAVMQVSNSLYGISSGNSSFVNAIKESLFQLGICSNNVAPPLCTFNDSEKTTLLERLKELGSIQVEGIQTVLKPLLSEASRRIEYLESGHGLPKQPVHLTRSSEQDSTGANACSTHIPE